jgi:lipopolysaccharide heptosyltransferase I
VLLIRPSALGDVCRTVPCLVSLRRAFPGAAIDWLVQDSFADAVRAHPALSGVVPFPRREMKDWIASGRLAPLGGWLRELSQRGYDLAIDLQGLARSGFFTWITGAPRRVGFANAREGGWLGLTETYTIHAHRHTVDRMLGLLRCMGVEPVRDMALHTPAADRAAIDRDPACARLRERPYAIIAPTSRWPAKQWPADRFAAAADWLTRRGLAVAVVGSASERAQIGPVLDLAARQPLVVDLVGSTSVGRLMSVVERSRLVVANDSAALHMAVGFDRPIVALFGPTNAALVGPYRRERDVLQHVAPDDLLDHKNPAQAALMERISTDEVIEACEERLAGA